jgi:hypothetical protein
MQNANLEALALSAITMAIVCFLLAGCVTYTPYRFYHPEYPVNHPYWPHHRGW